MVSTLSGPIPPHPYYDKADTRLNIDADHVPAGRSRPEAEEYMVKGTRGTVGNILAIEGHQCASEPRGNQFRLKSAVFPGKEINSRDHIKDNVRRMRQIQKETRLTQEEINKPVKALWKANKFDHIQSKVMDELANREGQAAPRPHSANYLRAHSRAGYAATDRPRSASQTEQRRPSSAIPSANSAREVSLKRNNIDFVKLNGTAARHSNMRRSPSLTALDDLKKKQDDAKQNYRKGTVPTYLRDRQRRWDQDEVDRLASEPDPEMPPGHRMMEQHEREQTLNKLKQTQSELVSKLSSLPIRTDTVHIRRKKEQLDKQLSEIEEAIKIFSRPKVFVRLDT